MKHSLMILVLAAGAGLLLLLISAALGHPASNSAAAQASEARVVSAGEWLVNTADLITCTLSTTTTDSLTGINSFATAAILADYSNLALVVGPKNATVNPEEDYFRLDNATPNFTYQVRAIPSGVGNYNLGIVVYNASYTPILTDTNTLDGNSATVSIVASNTGPYYFKVFQVSNYCSGGTYSLDASVIAPTSTPGPTSTGTPQPTSIGPTTVPGTDRFEPNYDFAHAATLATDVTYDSLNFVPWGGATEDNDFFKIWVKPGLFYVCETLNLAAGVDTNMIMYSGPSFDNFVAGNDDVTLGDYRSRISYFSNYEGFLYVLVGHGGRLPYAEVRSSTYSLRCEMNVPGQPTTAATSTPRPTSSAAAPTATPRPSSSPLPTPTRAATIPSSSGNDLEVRTLTTPTPPPAATTPALHFVPIDLLVYYDGNDDHSPGAGEGIAGILVLAFDTANGEQIAQGFTDELGHLQFTAAAQGAVRLSVPYLGINRLVGSEGESIYVRIGPQ